jgi:hypothetical protein
MIKLGNSFTVRWRCASLYFSIAAIALALVSLAPAPAQAFGANLPTLTNGDQLRPEVASMPDGGFVVAWVDRGDGVKIRAQRYDGGGNPQGGEIEVSSTNNSQAVAVAGLADGNFVVVWDAYVDGNNLYDVNARVFDGAGNPVGDTFWPGATTDYEYLPSVGALSSGDFVVSWTKAPSSGARSGRVLARRYSSGGEAKSDELLLDGSADSQSNSSVIGLHNEEYVIVWDRVNWGITGWDVAGKKYNNGNAQAGSFTASSDTLNIQWYPSAAKLTDNRFVVLWTDVDQNKSTRVQARIFDFDCHAIGGEHTVNGSAPWDRSRSGVTGMDDGGFMAVWSSVAGEGNRDLIVQRLDNGGNRAGDETRLAHGGGNQEHGRVAKRAGGAAVVWQSDGEDGSGQGVMGRLF